MKNTDTPETDAAWENDHPLHRLSDNEKRELCAGMERERDSLAKKFTKLDKPKYSGDPMLDDVLAKENADFRAWVNSLPPTYWARYDLSAARIGWEAACKFIFENS